MTLDQRIDALAARLGPEFKAVRAQLAALAGDTETFSVNGPLTVKQYGFKLPVMYPAVIAGVRIMVGTAPTGAALWVDVNKNGTTIFTNQATRPTIAAGQTSGVAGTPAVTTLVAGDYLTVDVDQVGSTVPGADLTVAVLLRRTA